MGIVPSKQLNPIVSENFDGEGGDHNVDASYNPVLGPEWYVYKDELEELKGDIIELDSVGEEVPEFVINRVVAAKCVKVYDGDTAHFAIKGDDGSWSRFRCRMIGYNSAEIRSRSGYTVTPEEKARGLADRDFLADMLYGKKVLLHLHKTDKYGRPLADVYLIPSEELTLDNMFDESRHVNKIMVKEGHGVPYMRE